MVFQKNEKVPSIITEQKHTGFIWDMHAHLTCMTNEGYKEISDEARKKLAYDELNYRRSQNIAAFFSCGTPEEWKFMQNILRDFAGITQRLSVDEMICGLSFGIHPWYSDRYEPEEYYAYFEECDAVGEIGMDSVWCEVPLGQQRRIFQKQLQIAADLGKPVILHTKGQEHEIGEMIRDFPGKVCVHWYSGDVRQLEAYLRKDCYFTLGPDFSWKNEEELYQYMIRNVPDDRLFLETDGLDAVIWAYEETGYESDLCKNADQYTLLSDVIYANLQKVSECKKKKPKEMLIQLQQNLFDFLSISYVR